MKILQNKWQFIFIVELQPNLLRVCLNTTNSHRAPNAVQSDTKRNPIGRRTESDRAADGIRSDGGRRTMTYCERNQAINMPHFRNLRFGNSGFEFKDGHKALTIKVFSAILSLTKAQNHTYLFTKRRFRKQSFQKSALFFTV